MYIVLRHNTDLGRDVGIDADHTEHLDLGDAQLFDLESAYRVAAEVNGAVFEEDYLFPPEYETDYDD